MRVLLADAPVGSPAGVPDPGRGGALCDRDRSTAPNAAQLRFERAQIADGADRLDPLVSDHGDAGGVIAAVLELAQPGEQQRLDGPSADVANDAAHHCEDT